MDDQALDGILQCLSDHGYSVLDLVAGVLSWHDPGSPRLQSAREDLERDAVELCACLFSHAPTSASVSSWASRVTQSKLRSEIEDMTKKKHGLHFSASTVTAEQIELTFMPMLAGKMRLLAPSLWGLVFTLLGALDQRRLSDVVEPLDINLAELFISKLWVAQPNPGRAVEVCRGL